MADDRPATAQSRLESLLERVDSAAAELDMRLARADAASAVLFEAKATLARLESVTSRLADEAADRLADEIEEGVRPVRASIERQLAQAHAASRVFLDEAHQSVERLRQGAESAAQPARAAIDDACDRAAAVLGSDPRRGGVDPPAGGSLGDLVLRAERASAVLAEQARNIHNIASTVSTLIEHAHDASRRLARAVSRTESRSDLFDPQERPRPSERHAA